MTDKRIEKDALGEVPVPAHRLWGAQTQRSVDNFPIGVARFGFGRPVVRAFGIVKQASARANAELGALPQDKADLIVRAAQEVIDGKWDDEFPLVVFQTGSGTQSNMNANEVIANRAIQLAGGTVGSKKPVHPNDDVNRSQSSNDAFPAVMHVATVEELDRALLPAIAQLRATLDAKAHAFADVVMLGRTHLQDATPVTLGQVISGWVAQLDDATKYLHQARDALHPLALGGTAVGTGINTPEGFAARVIERLAEDMHLPLTEARDHFEAQGARDALVEASGQLRTIAVGLYKIANDLRWMSSGPRAGLGEIHLPDLQPGSSIMPGKVNPVVPEAVCQVVAQVMGNDAAVAFGGSAGNLELNVMLPVIARNLLESIRLLANVSRLLADRCVAGLEPNVEVALGYAEGSPSIVTPLNRYLGYDEAAAIAKQALAEHKSIRDVVLDRGHVASGKLTEQQLDEALDVLRMTRP